MFLIKTYTVFLFNFVHFPFIIDNTKQLILEKHTDYLHTDHYTLKIRPSINFPKMLFLSDKELLQLYPKVKVQVSCPCA